MATIKPVESNAKSARFITMQGTHRFVEKDYTLKLLIAAAYNLSPRTISGGPAWAESDHYDILAVTPGEVRPTRDEQMAMLRTLLTDRFKLIFHREQKYLSIYALDLAKSGPKLKPSPAPPDDPAALVSTVYPQRICSQPATRRCRSLLLFCSELSLTAQWSIALASPEGTTSTSNGHRMKPSLGETFQLPQPKLR